MAMTLTQTDTAVTFSASVFCSSSGESYGGLGLCTSGGTAGTTPVSTTLNGSETGKSRFFECDIPASTSWDSGTWTVRFNVTTSNMNMTVTDIHICRVNSSGVNQATIGSATGLSISLGSTGVKTQTVSGSSQTPAAGDKVVVVLNISNSAMGSQAFSITPNQNIDSPFTASTAPQPNVNDSVTVTESVSMMLNPMLFNVSDTATVTESVKMNMLLFPRPFDTVTVTEHVNMNLVNNIGVFDTVTVTESARAHILVMPSVFDSVTVAESVTALLTSLNIAANDTVTIADDTVRVHIIVMPAVNDAITVTDAPQMNLLVMPSVFDTVTTTESVTVSVISVSAIQISAFDSVTVADDSTALLPFLALFVTDSITVTEDITVTEAGGVSPGTINYQGDGKGHYKKRRNRTQELFDNIEATLRAKMRGDVEMPSIGTIATEKAAVQQYADMPIKEAVRQLTIASKGYADLTDRLKILKRELREYDAEQRMRREIDDEEAFMMMGM